MTGRTRAPGIMYGRRLARCDRGLCLNKPRNYKIMKSRALIVAMSVGIMTVCRVRGQSATPVAPTPDPAPATTTSAISPPANQNLGPEKPSESPTLQLGEVTVTAEKQVGTEQDTPISMAVEPAEDLLNRGIVDVASLAVETPGVSLKSNGPGQTEFEMRGMTSSGGNSPTVGFYLDDVALTAPAGAQNGKVVIDPTLYDLNRVEVLRGPQGTLYGSSSMGGTIRLVSNQPNLTDYQGSAQVILTDTHGGNFNHGENGMVNLPLIDNVLAVRIVGSYASTSGWIDRVVVGDFPPATNNGATRGDVLA